MPDPQGLAGILGQLVQHRAVRGALVATFEGELIAAEAAAGAVELAATVDWAQDHATVAASYRRHIHQKEFHVLFDPSVDAARHHVHVVQVSDHLLALLFRERHSLGEIRRLSRNVAPGLEQLLRSSA